MVNNFQGIILGFLFGVVIQSLLFPRLISLSVVIILMIIATGVGLISRRSKYIHISFFMIAMALGLLRFSTHQQPTAAGILDVFVDQGQDIVIRGEIVAEPIVNDTYAQLVVEADSLGLGVDNSVPIETRILIKTDNYTDYEYGQRVRVEGVVHKPDSFVTDSDRVFNYKNFLLKDAVYYTMNFTRTQIIDTGQRSFTRSLFKLKQSLLLNIYRYIPEPESGLLAGVLFGEKSALSDEREDQFRIVGLMHIVVLSGYNISLVIQIFTKTLRFLPRLARSVFAVFGIIAFALLVGAGPTVIRASIMAVFIVLADVVGARYNITRALIFAGFLMVVWNPMVLYFDISFQLSFLATYGLIALSPVVDRWFTRLPTWLSIRESAVATVSAQIIVLPLLLYRIGEFSLISPLVNVLVLFAVPLSMLMGFLTAVLGFISPFLATIIAVISTYLLKYQLWIVDIFAEIPFASITVPPFHWVFMLIMYAGIFFWIYKKHDSSL